MKVFNEEDYLLISGIQHYIFCKRQWALIHIEQQWHENLRTVEGQIFHENAHDGLPTEKRGEIIISRGMSVFSRSLGMTGTCDVVELHKSPNGVSIFGRAETFQPIPIEYKAGKPKDNDSDILQLCAQAMCIEEMLLCHIPEGHLFYGETRHRLKVQLDGVLRERVTMIASEMHELYEKRYTPKIKTTNSCRACSLIDICVPRLCKNISVTKYVHDHITEVD